MRTRLSASRASMAPAVVLEVSSDVPSWRPASWRRDSRSPASRKRDSGMAVRAWRTCWSSGAVWWAEAGHSWSVCRAALIPIQNRGDAGVWFDPRQDANDLHEIIVGDIPMPTGANLLELYLRVKIGRAHV